MLDRLDAYDQVGNRIRQRNWRIQFGLAQFHALRQPRISRGIYPDTSREARTQIRPEVTAAASHVNHQLAADSQRLDGLRDQAMNRRLAMALAAECAGEYVIKGYGRRLQFHWHGGAREVHRRVSSSPV